MSEIKNIGLGVFTNLVATGIISGFLYATGFFQNLTLDTKLSVIGGLILFILLSCITIMWKVYKLENPSIPKLIKSHNEPDTYIFIRGRWRKIPDWQTRDYLATILDFRPGEIDINLESKDYVDKLPKSAPLESVFTYAKK